MHADHGSTGNKLYFNGINAVTGGQLLPDLDDELMYEIITGQERDVHEDLELKSRWNSLEKPDNPKQMAIIDTDYKDLSSGGWGVIFPWDVDEAVIQALEPLLAWRRSQAGERYREFTKGDGYRYKADGSMFESKNDWLIRHGVGPGPADPEVVPYYLLIVGSPEVIPYRFQTQLDVVYAVGRIYFDTLEEYARYAESVVAAEKKGLSLGKKAAFFGVANPDDRATDMSRSQLVAPLAKDLLEAKENVGWEFNQLLGEQATKAGLTELFNAEMAPALLFTASHGMGFPNGHPLQFSDQGALLCQDWPGPKNWRQAIGKDFYFAADDLASDANLFGMLAFTFACYGAGTPRRDEFARKVNNPAQIAPKDFLANLPQKMLGHPGGGALAVVGHVERAWGYSFMWGQAGAQLTVFKSTLQGLFNGYPIGRALEDFNNRYAELATMLTNTMELIEFGYRVDPAELTGTWTAHNDARNYVLVGDPAVRLMI
jgi:hypothetical protein